jgi:hypothetical protein
MVNPVRHTVTVGSREFLLIPGQEVAAVKVAVVGAVRAGGGFVDFPVAGNRMVSVLVTAGVHVMFHSEQIREEPPEENNSALPWGEDDYLFFD